jgi:hypothetical protein
VELNGRPFDGTPGQRDKSKDLSLLSRWDVPVSRRGPTSTFTGTNLGTNSNVPFVPIVPEPYELAPKFNKTGLL